MGLVTNGTRFSITEIPDRNFPNFLVNGKRPASSADNQRTASPVPELSFLPAPHIGAEPGRAKGESRITCMRMLRTPPFFPPKSGEKTIFGSTFQIRLGARFSE